MARPIKQYAAFKYKTPAVVLSKLRAMSDSDLAVLHANLSRRVTTNMGKIKKAGLTHSPAYMAVEKKIEKGRVTDPTSKTLKTNRVGKKEQMVRDIYAYQGFLTGKTHTMTGARVWNRKTNTRLGKEYASLTESQKRGYWKVYEEYRALISMDESLDSDQVQKEWLDYWSKGNYSYKTQQRVNDFNEQVLAMHRGDNDIETFFSSQGVNLID